VLLAILTKAIMIIIVIFLISIRKLRYTSFSSKSLTQLLRRIRISVIADVQCFPMSDDHDRIFHMILCTKLRTEQDDCLVRKLGRHNSKMKLVSARDGRIYTEISESLRKEWDVTRHRWGS
jgi:hypothetical protein